MEDLEAVKVPQDGHDLKLSVDRKIQYLAYYDAKTGLPGGQLTRDLTLR